MTSGLQSLDDREQQHWSRRVRAGNLYVNRGTTGAIVLRTLEVQTAEGTAFCDIVFDCGCGSGEVLICEKLLYNGLLIVCCVYLVCTRSNRASLERAAGKN